MEFRKRSNESVIVYSCIKKSMMKKEIMKGTAIAILSLIPLLLSFIYLKASILETYGLGLLILAFGGLYIGLGRYKALARIENAPNRLTITSHELIFSLRGKPKYSIPLEHISSMGYREGSVDYGLIVTLGVNPLPCLPRRYLCFKVGLTGEPQSEGSIIYFPYFSYASAAQIMECFLEPAFKF